jgi:hypothetical protein
VNYFCVVRHNSWRARFDAVQDLGDCLRAWFGAKIALAVNADAHGITFLVAFCDRERCAHFHLLGTLDFAADLIGALVDLGADFVSGIRAAGEFDPGLRSVDF